ncbi:uncharacterized protein ALTATR162_LOCUS2698 [Alternaria atra]|uniref:Uncharacterized protein n=1 Tax=Alternaria atra TaxID=119953 RepID=A0A8J2N399_9PLEO|nr:uncharacterized protein ALTATR162_LOCUS2698 [Alternaria atra]CAG5150554.1 unnamed protein product [Alternaria atra]
MALTTVIKLNWFHFTATEIFRVDSPGEPPHGVPIFSSRFDLGLPNNVVCAFLKNADTFKTTGKTILKVATNGTRGMM